VLPLLSIMAASVQSHRRLRQAFRK